MYIGKRIRSILKKSIKCTCNENGGGVKSITRCPHHSIKKSRKTKGVKFSDGSYPNQSDGEDSDDCGMFTDKVNKRENKKMRFLGPFLKYDAQQAMGINNDDLCAQLENMNGSHLLLSFLNFFRN